MAYMVAATLEFFIEDSFSRLTPGELERLIALYEPYRESIEHAMDRYEPECQSWRDTRNGIWTWLPDFKEEVAAILSEAERG